MLSVLLWPITPIVKNRFHRFNRRNRFQKSVKSLRATRECLHVQFDTTSEATLARTPELIALNEVRTYHTVSGDG